MSVPKTATADGSPIAPWLAPILWRESDWVTTLGRLATTATRANRLTGARAYRTAIELAQALEYVDPDRRNAIAAYELAGDHERARELASELGWWSARARLSARIIDSPEHVLDEACAWWDAGHPDLCALALAEVRGSDRGTRGAELEALLGERDLLRHAAEATARANRARGSDAAKEHVMAARFARAAGRNDLLVRWLEAAVVADPHHPIAAPFLLELACRSRDPEPLKRYMKLLIEGVTDDTTRVDLMRASALTLIRSEHYRGFGQRLLRQTLQKSYTDRVATIPGHLAMWSALAAHATTATTRRELLPFVIAALRASRHAGDRVWLAAYATEISLRDAHNPVVAGAYAEIVAEHAPDHPIVRELVATVANVVEDEPTNPIEIPIPRQAIEAARHDVRVEAAPPPAIDLETAYAEATTTPDDAEEGADARDAVDARVAGVAPTAGDANAARTAGDANVANAANTLRDANDADDAESVVISSTPTTVAVAIESARAPSPSRAPRTRPPTAPPAPRAPSSRPPTAPPSAPSPTSAPSSRPPTAPPAPRAPSSRPPTAPPSAPSPTSASASRPPTAPSPTSAPRSRPPTAPPSEPPATSAPSSRPSTAPPSLPSASPATRPPTTPPTTSMASSHAPTAPTATTAPTAPTATTAPTAPSATTAPASPAVPRAPTSSPPPTAPARVQSLPRIPSVLPTLAALRTPDRPELPAPPADPPNAKLRARRIAVPIDVRIELPDGPDADGTSRDISTSGLFVEVAAELVVGSVVSLVLLLPGEEAFTEDEYRISARVVRKADDGYGLELIDPSPALVAALDTLG